MARNARTSETAASPLREPEHTGRWVWLWNRGRKINRHVTRCGNLILAINVQAAAGDVEGRGGENSNRLERVRPGLARVDAGYWARVVEDVERAKAYAERSKSPLSGVAAWLDDGELIVLDKGVDGMAKRDAEEAIEGSADLTLILEIANSDSPHAQLARDHLERVTDGGAAILAHFGSHDH